MQAALPSVNEKKNSKLSAVTKLSLRSKPSAKTKHSLKLKPGAKKLAQKAALKQLADSQLPSKRLKGKQTLPPQKKYEDHPPLPPPSEPLADSEPSTAPWLEPEVICSSEQAGHTHSALRAELLTSKQASTQFSPVLVSTALLSST